MKYLPCRSALSTPLQVYDLIFMHFFAKERELAMPA